MLNCTLQETQCGWYLTFPHDIRAGLLLNTQSELTIFAVACSAPTAKLETIDRCPRYYYEKALSFKATPF